MLPPESHGANAALWGLERSCLFTALARKLAVPWYHS